MISEIKLSNYKSYREETIIFSPITVFCGANSSGKTAIIKSILLLKQSFEAAGNNYLLLNGEYTNNGQFSNTKTNLLEKDTIEICNSFNIKANTDTFRELCKCIGMSRRRAEIASFEIRAKWQFKEEKGLPEIGNIFSTQIELVTNFSNLKGDYAGKSISSLFIMETLTDSQHYNITLKSFPIPQYYRTAKYPFKYVDLKWDNCICYFRGMQLVSLYKDNLAKASLGALSVIYTLFRRLATEYENMSFLGPLRDNPSRHYFRQGVYDDIGVKGEYTAQYLGQFGRKEIFAPSPDAPNGATKKLVDAVNEWSKSLGVGTVNIESSSIPGASINQIMINDQNIVDVGFGVSQVLPILVQGLNVQPTNTLILEQPEIHLHPKMQMEMTDFIIKNALLDKYFIIETHSDHIINRLVRRALEDKQIWKLLTIYYIEKDENNYSKLKCIHLDDVLGIDSAPEGFFDQYSSESNAILDAGYRNMVSKEEDY